MAGLGPATDAVPLPRCWPVRASVSRTLPGYGCVPNRVDGGDEHGNDIVGLKRFIRDCPTRK
jgi:hypothetical protein